MPLIKVVRYTLKNLQMKSHEDDLNGIGMGDLQSCVNVCVFFINFLKNQTNITSDPFMAPNIFSTKKYH